MSADAQLKIRLRRRHDTAKADAGAVPEGESTQQVTSDSDREHRQWEESEDEEEKPASQRPLDEIEDDIQDQPPSSSFQSTVRLRIKADGSAVLNGRSPPVSRDVRSVVPTRISIRLKSKAEESTVEEEGTAGAQEQEQATESVPTGAVLALNTRPQRMVKSATSHQQEIERLQREQALQLREEKKARLEKEDKQERQRNLSRYHSLLTHKLAKKATLPTFRGEEITQDYIRRTGLREAFIATSATALGMRLPPSSFSVSDVCSIVGRSQTVNAIDVAIQSETKTMTLAEWEAYYNTPHAHRHKILNVISLEATDTPLFHIVKRPAFVDWIDWLVILWQKEAQHTPSPPSPTAPSFSPPSSSSHSPSESTSLTSSAPSSTDSSSSASSSHPFSSSSPSTSPALPSPPSFPPLLSPWHLGAFPAGPPHIQLYCLMSVQGSFTDFHIDFGGSAVWYHVLRGSKIFFLVPPSAPQFAAYEEWSSQGFQWKHSLLDHFMKTKELQSSHIDVITVLPGQTLFIPSGWLHAVYTPADSLVFGGNLLHSYDGGTQLMIAAMEKRLAIKWKYSFPFFRQIQWMAAHHFTLLLRQYQQQQQQEMDNKASEGSSAVVITHWEIRTMLALANTLRSWLSSSQAMLRSTHVEEIADEKHVPYAPANILVNELQCRAQCVLQQRRKDELERDKAVLKQRMLAIPVTNRRSAAREMETYEKALGKDEIALRGLPQYCDTIYAQCKAFDSVLYIYTPMPNLTVQHGGYRIKGKQQRQQLHDLETLPTILPIETAIVEEESRKGAMEQKTGEAIHTQPVAEQDTMNVKTEEDGIDEDEKAEPANGTPLQDGVPVGVSLSAPIPSSSSNRKRQRTQGPLEPEGGKEESSDEEYNPQDENDELDIDEADYEEEEDAAEMEEEWSEDEDKKKKKRKKRKRSKGNTNSQPRVAKPQKQKGKAKDGGERKESSRDGGKEGFVVAGGEKGGNHQLKIKRKSVSNDTSAAVGAPNSTPAPGIRGAASPSLSHTVTPPAHSRPSPKPVPKGTVKQRLAKRLGMKHK